jgi:hypothetical protein
MDAVIDMPLPAFPANNQQDIDNQIISNVSGSRLLQGYLDQRKPPWNDVSQLLDDSGSSDAVINCHGIIWNVHRDILKTPWPIFEDGSHQVTIDSDGRAVVVNYDDPLALEGLLVWLYSGRPPRTTTLKDFVDWEQLVRLWGIARKYRLAGLMDDIATIILCCKPPSWGSEAMLSALVSIISSQFDERYSLQANLFLKHLMQACKKRIADGELDGLLAMMPMPFALRKEELDTWPALAKVTFRNAAYYAMTNALLSDLSTLAPEQPENFSVLLNIWDLANFAEYHGLAYHIAEIILFGMEFFRVEETELLVFIMDSLTSLPETERNFRFREAVVSTLLAQCQRRVLSDDLWARFSEEQQECLLRAYARQSTTPPPRVQIAAAHSDFA